MKPVEKADVKKLSFKEKHELETLDKELPALEAKKEQLQAKLAEETEFQKLEEISAKIKKLVDELEEKELRWLELSERG